MPILVFTDLDGSLMEHESYSIEPARPALETLRSRDIPVIINSSKTAGEIEAVQQLLGFKSAFVCENGAAMHMPDTDQPQEFGEKRDDWLEAVHSLRGQEKYLFSGFSDWSPREISELTGLNSDQAALSKIRQYSEPILWRDSVGARQRFEKQLKDLGLRLLEGGRFLSIQGPYDKSNAMNWMIDQQSKTAGKGPVLTVALGDSPNDEAMLNRANIAVIIKSAKSARITISGPTKLIRTKRPGPAGWQDAITEFLSLYDSGVFKDLEDHAAQQI
jgi:mannosyl-3-phosphoglycerate phosphatase